MNTTTITHCFQTTVTTTAHPKQQLKGPVISRYATYWQCVTFAAMTFVAFVTPIQVECHQCVKNGRLKPGLGCGKNHVFLENLLYDSCFICCFGCLVKD